MEKRKMIENNTKTLDKTDQQIIEHLTRDGRKSYRQIAKQLNLSVGTITNRIQKLKETGIITGFQIQLNQEKLGYNLETIITLQTTKDITTILQKPEYTEHIQTAHNITGEYNTIIKAAFKNQEELNNFLKKLNNEPTISRTNTQLILETMNN